MRVLVTGGRDYNNRARVFRELTQLHNERPITLVIHGACTAPHTTDLRGADLWAQEWAVFQQVPYVGHPAPWIKYGHRAGPKRNGDMIVLWKPELVLAFPGSCGTADRVHKAEVAKAAGWHLQIIDLREEAAPAR